MITIGELLRGAKHYVSAGGHLLPHHTAAQHAAVKIIMNVERENIHVQYRYR